MGADVVMLSSKRIRAARAQAAPPPPPLLPPPPPPIAADVPLVGVGAEAFFIPPIDAPDDANPRLIGNMLVDTCERFQHLKHGEAVIAFFMRTETKVKQGRTQLGYIALPQFQGTMGDLAKWLLLKACGGIQPDYIMILDAPFWESATRIQREALVFHELCHTVHGRDKEGELKFNDEGRPVFEIQGHDIEEFNDVVKRYGAWLPDVTAFAAALIEGNVL